MIIRSDNYNANPVVACSIIVYNQKQWIGQCIEGMLMQQCAFPFNIVIADDCSTDGTQDVLRDYQQKYPDKIKLVLNEKNGGIAANWVSCCEQLEGGEYVAFCDGDDYWSNPKKLQLQVDYLCQHPECVALSTNNNVVNDVGEIVLETSRKAAPLTGWVQKDMFGPGKSIATWSTFMMRKDIFDQNMPLHDFVKYDFPFQDWPAMVIMAGYGEFHYLSDITTSYREGHESDSHAVDLQKLLRRQWRSVSMSNYLVSLFPYLRRGEDSIESNEKWIAGTLISTCLRNNDYRSAKHYAKVNGCKNLRNLCCQTWLTFQLFRIAKLCRVKMVNFSRIK